MEKKQIKVEYIHSIDWKNCELAMKQLPFSWQMWVSKNASTGHCGIGWMMLI
jgi:hypothetical protein